MKQKDHTCFIQSALSSKEKNLLFENIFLAACMDNYD